MPKGNPKEIRGLEGLTRPGLRLGIGDTTYSTSGVITSNILEKLYLANRTQAALYAIKEGLVDLDRL